MKLSYPVCVPDTEEKIMAWCQTYEEAPEWLRANGYKGIELLVRDADEIKKEELKKILDENQMEISAIGTTPMQKKDKLFLMSENKEIRKEAKKRLDDLLELGTFFKAPVLIGKYRGTVKDVNGSRLSDLEMILHEADEKAKEKQINIFIEPQNPDNINNLNTIGETVRWIETNQFTNVKLLMDIFHMNKTETSIEESLRKYKAYIGMIHMADSQRKVPGFGEMNIKNILRVLNEIGYEGYLSMEIKQEPDVKFAAGLSSMALRYMDREIEE